jgi:DNA polymerase III alpha subunit
MIKDKYGQIIYSENDLVELYLTDTELVFSRPIMSDSTIQFNQELDLDSVPKIIEYVASELPIHEFDIQCQNNWYMPDEYRNFDIAKFVLDQCQTEEEMQRAGHELLLYQEREMFILLKYLKYLVDTMRKNNIVWGVGRGSSVSSFVLFLIGVHKINSLYYGLEIEEFLK